MSGDEDHLLVVPCAGSAEGEFIREVLDWVGGKWTLLVVNALGGGPMRYSELLSNVSGISQRMLTSTLKQLERDGLVSRTAHAEVPPRVVYELEPLGASLLTAATALGTWAVEHREKIASNRCAATITGVGRQGSVHPS